MRKTLRAILATTVVAAALAISTAAPAVANEGDDPAVGPGASLSTIQRAGAEATDRRIDSLEVAIARVQGNDALTESNRAAILATLTSDLAAMNDLAGQIASDTTVTDAAADYRAIFTDYRVYAVALPQSLYAASADALTGSVLPRLQAVYDVLQAKVAGESDAEVEALLEDMEQKMQDAEAAAATIAADALAVTPAAWNADHTVLADIRAELRDATQDARDAARDARQIAQALR